MNDYPFTSLLFLSTPWHIKSDRQRVWTPQFCIMGRLYPVSCLEMCSKHKTPSVKLKSYDVKQFIYQRFYWRVTNGVHWWLLYSFKYANVFQICKSFCLWFLAGRDSYRVWSESLMSLVVPLVPWHLAIATSPQSNNQQSVMQMI